MRSCWEHSQIFYLIYIKIIIIDIPQLTGMIHFRTVSEFYQSKVMFLLVCYSVKNRGKQPIFLAVFFNMAGVFEKNVICFLGLRLPYILKNVSVFWKLFLQNLKTERIAHQDGGHEAGRTICFEWYFGVIRLICLVLSEKILDCS